MSLKCEPSSEPQIEQLKLAVEYSKGGANLENEAECAGREGMPRDIWWP